MVDFYINRRLVIDLEHLSEQEVLDRGSVFVVLAEPGAGKTELLGELGRIWGVKPVRASLFRHSSRTAQTTPLIVDAVDEAARIDQSAVDQIIVRAREACDGRVVFASRSSEWAEDRTRLVRDCFGTDPIIVRIEAFSDEEQKRLFDTHLHGESFSDFSKEVERFGLSDLLGNPQFLKLLADAFVQGGRRFSSRTQIFEDAVDRLALELGPIAGQRRAPTKDIVAAASEIMAKLLLSGTSGTATKEQQATSEFPYLPLLLNSKVTESFAALDTKLFKPTAHSDHHEPAHRIVAEYCAARYIVGRVSDARNPLPLRRILAVIAPNGFVRDELRGLVGWLATVGSEAIQWKAVELDPYAVLGNGDPSRLATSSKRRLLQALEKAASMNPGFRRGDYVRKFSVNGFFCNEVAEDVVCLLRRLSVNSPLTDLLLELLVVAGGPTVLVGEVSKILHDVSAAQHTRVWASRALIKISGQEPEADFQRLLDEGTAAALGVAVDMVHEAGADAFSDTLFAKFLDVLILHLQPPRRIRDDAIWMASFELKNVLAKFAPQRIALQLDRLTENLACSCGRPNHDCQCRRGVSIVAGRLLDRYFTDIVGPHHPQNVWKWIRALWYEHQGDAKTNAAIRLLVNDDGLRHYVHRLAFINADSIDTAWDIRWSLWDGHHHSGLLLRSDDDRLLTDYAFEINNVHVWAVLWHRPRSSGENQGPDERRRRLREQAAQKPTFAAEWARRERRFRLQFAEDRSTKSRRLRRRERKDRQQELQYQAKLFQERELIESGRDWGWVNYFTNRYLSDRASLSDSNGEKVIAENCLKNCLHHLAVPSLAQLAVGRNLRGARAAFASTWIHSCEGGALDRIDTPFLLAAYVEANRSGWMDESEFKGFEHELEKRLFKTVSDVEAFARGYIEPGLMGPREGFTHVWWLVRTQLCSTFRSELAREWLWRFPDMPASAQETLFNLAIMTKDRHSLLALIGERARAEAWSDGEMAAEANDRHLDRRFWRIRRFFFESEDNDGWDDLRFDPKSIFAIDDKAGRLSDGNKGWPGLSAEKIYKILDAFVEEWPEVHLPNTWGTGDPDEQRAYRFLRDEVWRISRDAPDRALPVLDRLIADRRFAGFDEALSTMRAETLKKLALSGFTAPTAREISSLFDVAGVASVEDLRALMVEELENLQDWLRTAETDALETYYRDDLHVDENTARNRVVDVLRHRMTAMNMPIVIEHHMADSNRCDFTASAMIEGRRRLLVVEAKGQWHPKLFSAAAEQLNERYATHHDAESQGVYLVFWFGPDVKVADRVGHDLRTASDLRTRIEETMPAELRAFIDVVVLDVSRHPSGEKYPPRSSVSAQRNA
ncbi:MULTISPECIES: NACHT domain-containing NTPase [unclassified Rhizobium]|nr:hypothetical protein [Rhizobium sp. WW_1]